MSDLLYTTRLRWDIRAGVAKLHGRTVLLRQAPDLGSGEVHSCDYVPEVCIAEIQPRACDPRRDMTAAEIAAADAVLRQCAGESATNRAKPALQAPDAPGAHL